MNAEFIDHRDIRWKNFLQRTKHDFYHLPEYVELAAADEGAMPMAFYAEEGEAACLIPLLIRHLPQALHAPPDWCDCASPYGYSGLLISPSEERLHSFLEAFCQSARARGIVTAFVRLHPLFALEQSTLGKFGQLVLHGQTVYIDLSESEESIWTLMSTNHQRNIKKLTRLGFHVSFDDWSRFHDFITIYHSTMRRVEAADLYFFSSEYFENLREKLGNRVHLICVLTDNNELAAAGLFIATGGIVQYHLGGTATHYLPLSPSKLMLDFAWRWAKAQSYDVLHLGGGVGGAEDSLFHFKAGFSPARGEFYTYRVVVDELKHATLQHAAQSTRREENAAPSDFFPVYRHFKRQND